MVRVTVMNKGSCTSKNRSHTKLNGSLTWYFVVLDPVQLILFSSEETLMAVTRLPDDIYGSPITESIDVPTRSTRSQQPVVPDSLTSQEGAQPINPPAETSLCGILFCGLFLYFPWSGKQGTTKKGRRLFGRSQPDLASGKIKGHFRSILGCRDGIRVIQKVIRVVSVVFMLK